MWLAFSPRERRAAIAIAAVLVLAAAGVPRHETAEVESVDMIAIAPARPTDDPAPSATDDRPRRRARRVEGRAVSHPVAAADPNLPPVPRRLPFAFVPAIVDSTAPPAAGVSPAPRPSPTEDAQRLYTASSVALTPPAASASSAAAPSPVEPTPVPAPSPSGTPLAR